MTEDTKIIEHLKNLKKNNKMPDEKKFLSDLRIKLSNRILAHSVINPTLPASTRFQDGFLTKCFGSANTFFAMIHPRSKSIAGSGIVISKSASIPWYLRFSFANTLVIPHAIIMPHKTVAIVFIVCVIGLSGIALASQRSLPGDKLYPIKILSEEVQSSLAYTPESKAIIYTSFTAKRVDEVKAILDQKDISPEILDLAMTNLQKNTNDTAAIIDEESQRGADVATLAKNINDSLDDSTEKLKQIFNNKKDDLKKEEVKLKDKIAEAIKTNDQATVASLTTRLGVTKNIRKSLESRWNNNEKTIKEKTNKIEKQMDDKEKLLNKKNRAEKTIAEAKNEKQQLVSDLLQRDTALATPDMFNEFDFFLNMAEKAYSENNYDDAQSAANESIAKLKIIENAVEEKSNENENSSIDNDKIQSQNTDQKEEKVFKENISASKSADSNSENAENSHEDEKETDIED